MEIVNSTEIIKKYFPINQDFTIGNLDGSLITAVDKLSKFIPIELIEELNVDANTLSANQLKLLPYIQEPLVRLALLDYLDKGQMEISDAGAHVSKSERRGTPWEWQIDQTKTNLKFNGYNAIQKALTYLRSGEGDVFDFWTNSVQKINYGSNLINNADEFSEIYNIGNNFLLFVNIQPMLTAVQNVTISPIISTAQMDELRSQILNRSVTPENEILINLIKPVIVFNALISAIPRLSALFTEAGVIESYKSERQTIRATATTRDSIVSLLIRDLEENALKSKSLLEAFIVANASDYPIYESSSSFITPEDVADVKINSAESKTFTSY